MIKKSQPLEGMTNYPDLPDTVPVTTESSGFQGSLGSGLGLSRTLRQ